MSDFGSEMSISPNHDVAYIEFSQPFTFMNLFGTPFDETAEEDITNRPTIMFS